MPLIPLMKEPKLCKELSFTKSLELVWENTMVDWLKLGKGPKGVLLGQEEAMICEWLDTVAI